VFPPLGSVVAIDSEFVYTSLEVEGDSAKSVDRGTNHTLARVSVILEVSSLSFSIKYSSFSSCCRKESPESVFLDDYIHVREPIVDYLTRFSGIKEGELTPGISPHPLSTSKNTYIKLVFSLSLFFLIFFSLNVLFYFAIPLLSYFCCLAIFN